MDTRVLILHVIIAEAFCALDLDSAGLGQFACWLLGFSGFEAYASYTHTETLITVSLTRFSLNAKTSFPALSPDSIVLG